MALCVPDIYFLEIFSLVSKNIIYLFLSSGNGARAQGYVLTGILSYYILSNLINYATSSYQTNRLTRIHNTL